MSCLTPCGSVHTPTLGSRTLAPSLAGTRPTVQFLSQTAQFPSQTALSHGYFSVLSVNPLYASGMSHLSR